MTRPTVLVVDDDIGVREAVRTALEPYFNVYSVGDSDAAHRIVGGGGISAVILDLLLPDVDGLETLQELKAAVPAMPVIILTAVKTVRTAVAAMKLGAVDYLTKPFDEEELRSVLYRTMLRPAAPHDRVTRQIFGSDGPFEQLARVTIVADDLGRRAALDVAIRRIAMTEAVSKSQNVILWRRAPLLWCIIVDTASCGNELLPLAPLNSSRYRGAEVLFLRAADAKSDNASARGKGSFPLMNMAEVINRVRLFVASRTNGMRQLPRMTAEVGRAIEWLSVKYADAVSVDRLARAVGSPADRLSQAFRAQTGFTSKEFLTKVRVEVARALLATTDEKQETIAAKVGFYDGSHLSRAFVEHIGRRPSAYRSSQKCQELHSSSS